MIPDPRQRPTLSIEDAGRLLGLGRSAAYDLARRDEFPVPVIRMGSRRLCVATAHLLNMLGLEGTADALPDDEGTCAECGGARIDWQPANPAHYGRATGTLCGRCARAFEAAGG